MGSHEKSGESQRSGIVMGFPTPWACAGMTKDDDRTTNTAGAKLTKA